ncbi:MAG: putative quinol monooxygenase [Sphingomonadaceae bacterium]
MSIVIVMGYMRVREGDVDRLRSAIAALTLAARTQDGCEHYSLSQDVTDPSVLRVSERWRDRAAQAMHMVGDHMVTFNLDMRRGKIVEADINVYDSDGGMKKLIYVG